MGAAFGLIFFSLNIYIGLLLTLILALLGAWIGNMNGQGLFEYTLRTKAMEGISSDYADKYEFEISRDNLTVINKEGTSINPWEAFDGIEVKNEFIYFVNGDQEAKNTLPVIPLPLVAFDSERDCEEFIRLAKEYFNESRK